VCQFPVRRRSTTRTLCNQLLGGDTIRMADDGARTISWQLRYKNLTNDEWSSIEQLFENCEGRLSTFTFVDPTDNLLMWSEDWSRPAWSVDPLIEVTPGAQDPFGGTGALQITNTSQTAQRMFQTIGSASWFQYCFSVYLRSDVATSVRVVASAGLESRKSVIVDTNWTRVINPAKLSSNQDGIAFGLELPAGTRLDAFGPQVEAQPAAGYYKKTTDRGGVYGETRFDTDSLTLVSDGPNENSSVVNLISGAAQ